MRRFALIAMLWLAATLTLAGMVGCSVADQVDDMANRSAEMDNRLQDLILRAQDIENSAATIVALIEEAAVLRGELLNAVAASPDNDRLLDMVQMVTDLMEELSEQAESLHAKAQGLTQEVITTAEYQAESTALVQDMQRNMQMLRMVQGLAETVTGRRFGAPPRPQSSQSLTSVGDVLPWALPLALPLLSRRFRGWAGRKIGGAAGAAANFMTRVSGATQVGPQTPLAPPVPYPPTMYMHPQMQQGINQAAGYVNSAAQQVANTAQQVQRSTRPRQYSDYPPSEMELPAGQGPGPNDPWQPSGEFPPQNMPGPPPPPSGPGPLPLNVAGRI